MHGRQRCHRAPSPCWKKSKDEKKKTEKEKKNTETIVDWGSAPFLLGLRISAELTVFQPSGEFIKIVTVARVLLPSLHYAFLSLLLCPTTSPHRERGFSPLTSQTVWLSDTTYRLTVFACPLFRFLANI